MATYELCEFAYSCHSWYSPECPNQGLCGLPTGHCAAGIGTTRAYTLTGLTNYTWHTVTLNAMLDSIPFLTDTVRMMPTDWLVYLPLVLKAYGRF